METGLSATLNQGCMFGDVFPVSTGNNNGWNEQKLFMRGAVWFGFKSRLQDVVSDKDVSFIVVIREPNKKKKNN